MKSKIDLLLDAHSLLSPEFHYVQRKRILEEVEFLEGKRSRILNTRLVRLKNTLAVFDTPTLGAVERDVCLQRV